MLITRITNRVDTLFQRQVRNLKLRGTRLERYLRRLLQCGLTLLLDARDTLASDDECADGLLTVCPCIRNVAEVSGLLRGNVEIRARDWLALGNDLGRQRWLR